MTMEPGDTGGGDGGGGLAMPTVALAVTMADDGWARQRPGGDKKFFCFFLFTKRCAGLA